MGYPRLIGLCLSQLVLAIWPVLLAGCATSPQTPSTEPAGDATSYDQFGAATTQLIRSYTRYPADELAHGIQGALLYMLITDRDGTLRYQTPLVTSTDDAFNAAAAGALRRMLNDGVRITYPGYKEAYPSATSFSYIVPVAFCIQDNCPPRDAVNSIMKDSNAADAAASADLDKGLLKQAIDDETSAISDYPQHDRYYRRALAYARSGSKDLAIKDLDKAIAMDPEYWEALNFRGELYYEKKQYDQALADQNKAMELAPDSAVLYCNRSSIYKALQQWDAALADSNKFVELAGTGLAYNNRAWIYHLMSHAQDGMADANKAVELDPNEASFVDTRAHLYEDLGQRDAALADYRKALDLNPSLTISREGLARLSPSQP